MKEDNLKKYPKGHFVNMWMAIGLPLGIPLGLAFGSPAFIGIGAGLGMVIGMSIGYGVEEKSEDFNYITKRARKEGYKARSVYKLFFINRKYGLIKENDRVLDLGCWPGSWLQACLKFKAKPRGTREMKQMWYDNSDSYMGEMLTVKYQELTPDGIPRFPIAIRFRSREDHGHE